MRKNSKLVTPNVVGATRRNFLIKGSLVGAGALAGSAALLQTVNNEAKAAGEPIPVGQATPLTDFAAAALDRIGQTRSAVAAGRRSA